MVAQAPSALEVYLNAQHVGTIVALSARDSVFSFSDAYFSDELRPTLSLGLLDAYGRPRASRARVGRIAPFFANVLPEGELRDYITHRDGIDPKSDFALLWLVGVDLPGAVIVCAPEEGGLPPIRVGGPARKPTTELLRFSLAGVQLKFSAMHNARGGLTIPVSGRDGNALLKLPSSHFPNVPQNEYAMMQFARAVGLHVPGCRLISLSDVDGLPADIPRSSESQAFSIARFDRRDDGARVHIEDFNQLYRQYPEQKYDNFDYNRMARDIYRLMGVEGLVDFVSRLVFTIAIGNTDMHLKNWSVIYRDGQTPELAPVYDYLCTSAYQISGRNELALQLGSVKAFSRIDETTFREFARRADVSSRIVMTAARNMIERIHEMWPKVREQLPPELAAVQSRIAELLDDTPLFQGRRGTALRRQLGVDAGLIAIEPSFDDVNSEIAAPFEGE